MKKTMTLKLLIILCITFLANSCVIGQKTKKDLKYDDIQIIKVDLNKAKNDSDPVYTIVEQMPLFKGAKNEEESTDLLYEYITKRAKADNFPKKGIVYVRFIVNKQGKTEKVEVVRGINSDLDNLAYKYVSEMPLWTPGKQKGITAKVQFIVAVKKSFKRK